MRLADELHEIVARPEPRIDLEEVLDAVAVVGVEMAPLLEHGAEPDGGRAEVAQVVELRGDAGDGAALPAAAPGPRPPVPAPSLIRWVRPAGPPRGCCGRAADA